MLNRLNLAAAISLLAFTTACSAPLPGGSVTASSSSSQANGASVMGKISMEVRDANGNIVYTDAVSNSTLQLQAGKAYSLKLSVANPQPGASYKLQSTQTNVVSGGTNSIALQLGNNAFALPQGSQGDYSWKFIASAPNLTDVTKFYLAAVQCSSPTFTQPSLDPTKITVSGSGNIYSFSAAGITSGANGMAPYTCAWDPTGTGVQDTAFGPCDSAVNAYVNYVGNRNVGLLVKDACFTTHAVSHLSNLVHTTPSMPGNVFIQGTLSNAGGSAVGDSRIDGVSYLATNAGGNNIVQPNYSRGTFTIEALQNYGMPSSVKFGMQIAVAGLTDNINVSTGTGTVSAANAQIQKVTYSTDQAGDEKPVMSLSSSSCTLSNQGAKVTFITGQPCSSGKTGDNNSATVEVWGHYVCNSLTATGASTKVEGDFDGYTDIVDSCSGGGGGGGGVAPISL